MAKQEPIERARDELFSHIHRCGVLEAEAADQDVWMTETVEYLAERYPDLDVSDLAKLKKVGMQFCKPVISRLRRSRPADGSGAGDGTSTDGAVIRDTGEALLGEPREA